MQPWAAAAHASLVLVVVLPAVFAARPLRRGGQVRSAVHDPGGTRATAAQSPVALAVGGASEGARAAARAVDLTDCGPLATYPNAQPASYENARATRYDPETKQTVEVRFSAGDVVEFECRPGYTIDGAKDGVKTFDVTCSELGYYKPSGVCIKAAKCGAVPVIPHAFPTGEKKGEGVVFSCTAGYSLDGEAVVKGGFAKNERFTLECNEFSGEYKAFEGECKPYAFVPATESVRVYNQVFEALFIVSCKGTLKKAFGAGAPPDGLDAACSKIQDPALQGQCGGLVSQIKSDFEAQKAAREAHDEQAKKDGKDWYDAKDPDRPGIGTQADTFCRSLWGLLAVPEEGPSA